MELTASLLAQLVALAALFIALPTAWATKPRSHDAQPQPPCCGEAFLAAMNATANRLTATATRIERATEQPQCAVRQAAEATRKRTPEKPAPQRAPERKGRR